MPTTVLSSARIDSRAEAISATGSREADGLTQCAKAPSGMLREDSVHAAQRTLERGDAMTLRANVVLPTPAAPTKTTPQLSVPPNADRMASCSTGRSSNCQRRPMESECMSLHRLSEPYRTSAAKIRSMHAEWSGSFWLQPECSRELVQNAASLCIVGLYGDPASLTNRLFPEPY